MNACHSLAAVLQLEDLPNELTKSFLGWVTETMNKYSIDIHRNLAFIYTVGSKTDQKVVYACVGQTFQRVGRIPDQASNFKTELVAIIEAVSRVQEGDITTINGSRSAVQAIDKYVFQKPNSGSSVFIITT